MSGWVSWWLSERVGVLFEFILRVTDVSGRASNLVAQMI